MEEFLYNLSHICTHLTYSLILASQFAMRKWPPPLWRRHVMPGLHHHGNCAHYRTCDQNYRQIYLLWRILIWHGNGSKNKDLSNLKFSEKSRLLHYGLCMAGIAWRSWVRVLCCKPGLRHTPLRPLLQQAKKSLGAKSIDPNNSNGT